VARLQTSVRSRPTPASAPTQIAGLYSVNQSFSTLSPTSLSID
jgi:hypothetical protein